MVKPTLLLVALVAIANAQLDMDSDKMGFEDNVAEESQSEEQIFTGAITAKPLLNDGKPFYVARDPTTGTLDFNVKKNAGISNDIPVSRKDELSGASKNGHDINSIGPNSFHDYLNLPVKYSSSKFVYPLISGSYANLKYQGNNKNHVSNHKNYTTSLGTTTQSPKYFTHITHPVKNVYTATFKHPEPVRTQTVQFTTSKPTTTSQSTTPVRTTQSTTETPTTSQSTTVKYSSTIVQDKFPSTFKNKYVDSSETRKKSTMATTTTKVVESSTPPANPVKFLDDLLDSFEMKETKPTTYRPPFAETRLSFSTSMPLAPSGFRPMPTEAPQNQSQKITFETGSRDPSSMSLSEIINSFSGNDDLSSEINSIPYETADSKQVEVKTLPPPTITPAPYSPIPVTPHMTLQQQMQNQQQMHSQQPPLNTQGNSHNQQQQNSHNQQKHNQQQQQHNQQAPPQFIDLPVHNRFAPPAQVSHIGFPNEHFEDYVEFENPTDNQFVKYEVQKPNTNFVKFNQMPSMNNVVISPGQNSASFVLGSQQSVGSVGVGSSLGVGSSHSAESSGPMKVGQVINDDPPIRSPQNPNSNQIQASIRFPSDAENAFDNAQIVKGTIKLDGSSESVQPPQALLQNQQTSQSPLVFPHVHSMGSNSMNAEHSYGNQNPSQVIFENVNDIYEKINDKKQRQEISSNELLSNIPQGGELTPPQILTPPNPTQQRPFNRQPLPPQQQFNMRRPGPPRSNLPGLPNILPQFRPNAKNSQGHPHMYKDVGAIRIPVQQGPGPFNRQYQSQVPSPKVGLPPMMAQQNPNQHPNYRRLPNRPNYPMRANGPSHAPLFENNIDMGNNRRVYRPAPPPPPQMNSFMKPPHINHPGFHLKRPNGPPETMQMQQRPSNIPQLPDFELNKSSPPAPQQFAQKPAEADDDNSTRLEPVITLQMLQNKKGGNKLNLPPVPHDIPQDIQSVPNNHKDDGSKKPSIYVVYPVTADSYENSAPLLNQASNIHNGHPTAVVGNRGDSPVSEYQNTPFSVVSHFEQEPLLMKKDKKKNPFPYHLERPAHSNDYNKDRPKYGQPHEGMYNIGEEPTNARVVNKRPPPFMGEHPDSAISSKLTRVTEKPIAIAYTPTEPTRRYSPLTNYYHSLPPQQHYSHHYDPHLSGDKFSSPNYGGPVISEILDEKHIGYDYFHRQQQLQQHLNNGEDLDFYKEHYDFQAPFQASVSLTPEVTNPYEGWSIVTQSTDTNKIDRSDLHLVDSSEESSTRKFDPNEFQPVFESGFQPIYSERKVSTAPELLGDSSELPSTLALTFATQPPSIATSPSPTTSSDETSPETRSSEETTAQPAEKKKQKVEIDSLEAFFESLTRDYDDDESTNKSENESSSRSL